MWRLFARVLVVVAVVGGVAPVAAARPALAAGDDAPAAQEAPLGTVLSGGHWAVDTAGRVLLLHGVSLPVTDLPDATEAARITSAGFDAVRLQATFSDEGLVVDVPGTDTNIGGRNAAVDTLAAAVTMLYDHGIVTLLDLVPQGGGAPQQDHLVAALSNVSQRFKQVAGLVGIEIEPSAGENARLVNAAVRKVDRNHLLWRSGPAQFAAGAAAGAGVVTNGTTVLLTGWGDGSAASVAQLAQVADAQQIGWFYDQPAAGDNGDALVRPYAAALAGTPTAYTFAPASRVFTLQYDTARVGGGLLPDAATTQISVPATRYPEGYRVQVSGGRVVSKPGAGDVCVKASPGQTRVAIRIEPAALGQGVAVSAGRGLAGCPSGAVAPAGAGNVGVAAANAPVESVGPGGPHKDQTLTWALPIAGGAAMLVLIGGIFGWRRRQRRRSAGGQPEDTSPYL